MTSGRKIFGLIFSAITVTIMIGGSAGAVKCVPAPDPGKCTSVLPESWCTGTGQGILEVLGIILDVMTAGVGVLVTVGIVVSAVQWITARDNEAQVKKVKGRLLNIVIGALAWVLMWSFLNWIIPDFSTEVDFPTPVEEESVCPPGMVPVEEGEEEPPATTDNNKIIGNPKKSSVDIPCDPRTRVYKEKVKGYVNGVMVYHKLCYIPTMPDGSSYAILNSRVSGAAYAMGEAIQKAGIKYRVGGSFRPFTTQLNSCKHRKTRVWEAPLAHLNQARREYAQGKKITKHKCYRDPPLSWAGYSNHQSGTAIDVSPRKGPLIKWLEANAKDYGFQVLKTGKEIWHWSTDGS